MSLVQWGLTAGTKGVLNDAVKDGKVAALADTYQKLIVATYPDDPKGVTFMLINCLVIPIIKIMMKEDADGYAKIKASM